MGGADGGGPSRDVPAVAAFGDEIDVQPLVEADGLHEYGFGRLSREKAELADPLAGLLTAFVSVLDTCRLVRPRS
jgi:hypothetical protein